jgi:hypothetical protein
MMRTPVAVFVFNRPAETSRVLDAIQRSRPSTLFVVADGPRPDRPADRDAVSAVRALFTRIEWPCEITTNFSEVNLGCRRRVSSGLDWVFEHVDEAIILEDDTVPLPSFFPYCEELLDRYRFDARIGSISGTDFTGGRYRMVESYGLSRYNLFWGWATWKRAWSVYDDEMKPLDETGARGVGDVLARTFELRRERLYWRHVLSRAHAGQIDSWGYRWLLSCWNAGLLGIQPAHSLVSNIGVGEQATHTSRGTYDTGELREMMFPLTHSRDVLRNPELDRAIEDRIFSKNVSMRLKWFMSRLVGR